MSQEMIGFSSIVLTILIWGTWLIFSRDASKQLANPFFENLLITLGALSCNIVIFFCYYIYSGESFEATLFLFPFLSGILWAFAGLFAFISISKIGVGKAMSIWAPSGMIVSFLWGVLYYNEFSGNILSATIAISIIVFGVISVIRIRNTNDTQSLVLSGAFFAFLSSLIWGGTYLVPLKELSTQISPFITLLPLSVGMVVGALGIFLVKNTSPYPELSRSKINLPLFLSGFMWSIGNFFALIAVIYIGIGKAYPMAELCGIVNALFAIFVLREITDKKKIYLFLGATVVSFSGAIWLSIIKI